MSDARQRVEVGAVPAALKQSRAEASEIAKLTAEVERLSSTIVEQAIELAALRGKASWG